MSHSPLVSVIMNCRNGEAFLREAIESVVAQTYSRWEIIFYDNLSTDSSVQIAKSYGEKINVIIGKSPLPLGEARNEALKHARGELIGFLDCDDYWFPLKLERQVKIFSEHHRIGFAHGAYYLFFNDTSKLTRVGETNLVLDSSQQIFREQLTQYSIGIMTVLFRRELLDQLKVWFDPRLSLVEDAEFFLKLMYLTPAFYDPEPFSKYRIHQNNLSHRLKDQWADEFEILRQSLIQLVPNFEKMYSVEDRGLRARVAFFRARTNIMAGNSAAARRHLKEFRFHSMKMFLFYLVSFFPSSIWKNLYRFYFWLRYS